jgi:hypothetical protein
LYEVTLDWRPLSKQAEDHLAEEIRNKQKKSQRRVSNDTQVPFLETVVEADDERDEEKAVDDEGNIEQREHPLVTSAADLTPPDKRPEKELIQRSDTGDRSMAEEVTAALDDRYCVRAKIQARLITKYTPPVLPKLKKDNKPLFSFWAPKPDIPGRARIYKVGEQVKTPFGLGVVEEHREKAQIVVVKMAGWRATAYLNEQSVELVSKGLLESLLGPFGSVESMKPLEFPYAEGTKIKTPFGEGKVTRPLPVTSKGNRGSDVVTIGIALIDWSLANESHPIVYCTVETAQRWRENKGKDSKSTGDGLLTAFGNLVSKSFLTARPTSERKPPPTTAPRFNQYFKDGAAVSTDVGPGMILRFRESDGFYEVSLLRWRLADGGFAKAFLRKEDIRTRIAKGCIEGYPVLTYLGLTGILASVDPTTGVHIVTIPDMGIVCYLQPDNVLRPLKAAVGEEVLTAYGDGKVTGYQIENNVYEIALKGWNAKLYAKAETFDRAENGTQTHEGVFGINWLFNMLFFSSDNSAPGAARSRSNSLVSHKSASGRSITK